MRTGRLASQHSATSFLNSFLLEWDIGVQRNEKEIIISLDDEETLHLPLKYLSTIGRHHYEGSFYLGKDKHFKKIDFNDLVQRLSQFLAHQFGTDSSLVKAFIERVNDSELNIDRILRHRSQDLSSAGKNFIEHEQMLFIGHNFHPTPKSREEFSSDDMLKYSPEMKARFPLNWILLSSELYFEKCSSKFADFEWMKNLFQSEGFKMVDGFTPFPIHPWQAHYIFQHPDIQDYLAAGKIKVLETSDSEWWPTSSLRTLYAPHASYMLKFSMNVKLTNSVRQLLVHELDRGLQVHEVFHHPEGIKFSNEYKEFSVIHEPVYAAIKDKSGNPIKETLILGRENPFREEGNAIVLATLTQDNYEFHGNALHKTILKYSLNEKLSLPESAMSWFKEFLFVAIRPLIMAQANFGILLGSHQQNMVLELKDDRPFRSYFRDCNGTGYSQLGKNLFSQDISLIEESNGNILDQDPANYLFGYYVIINSTFNVIASICHSRWLNEEELLKEFRFFLKNLLDSNPKDKSFLIYLLENETLMHKGNFLCAFKNINENTQNNPLAIYTKIPNPIYTKGEYL